MSSYHYLIASLPTLKTEEEMPFDYGTFLEMCRNTVSASVFSRLQELTVLSGKGPFLSDWAEFYGRLHNELVYQRKLKLGKKANPPSDREENAVTQVRRALNAKNPLEAENVLLDLEFAKIDELTGMHYFDEVVLFGYGMKLKLLERKNAFTKEEGRQEFGRLFDHIQEQINNI